MGAGNWPRILKLGYNIYIRSGRIFDIFLVSVSRDFELGKNVSCEESTVSPVLDQFIIITNYCIVFAISILRQLHSLGFDFLLTCCK